MNLIGCNGDATPSGSGAIAQAEFPVWECPSSSTGHAFCGTILREVALPPIRVTGLHTAFGDKVIHEGLHLEVRPGEILGVVGGSGSGKSVLLNSILGLRQPDGGSVELFGRDIGETVANRLRDIDDIAYVRFASEYYEFRNVGDILAKLEELNARTQDVKEQQPLFDGEPGDETKPNRARP